MGTGKKLLIDAFKWRRRAHVIKRKGLLPFLAFQGAFRALPKGAKRPVVEGMRLRRKYHLAKHLGHWFLVGALIFALIKACGV
jgi:hypothetical protein